MADELGERLRAARYIERREATYRVARTRVFLDSIVCCVVGGQSPEAIAKPPMKSRAKSRRLRRREESAIARRLDDPERPRALRRHALVILERLRKRANGPWVFPSPTTDRPIENPQKAAERLRERSKVPDLRLHDPRRTA